MSNMKETFADYLARVMNQKGLKPRDIKQRCGIAESYVRRMLKGEVTNLTVETIGVLAEGLDIDPVELFIAANGKPRKGKKEVDLVLLADTIQRLILNPELVEVIQQWLRLSDNHRQTFLQTAKLIKKKPKAKSRRK
jgi:transcriptional regulator with XRE-family HTH domain